MKYYKKILLLNFDIKSPTKLTYYKVLEDNTYYFYDPIQHCWVLQCGLFDPYRFTNSLITLKEIKQLTYNELVLELL